MRKTVSWLETSQTADALLIRLQRKALFLWVLAVFVGVPFTIDIAYQNIVGTPYVAAFWDRSADDRIAGILIFVFMFLPWGIGPIVGCILCFRKYRRPWAFSRQSMQLTRLDQNWPLVDLTAVAVEVRRKYKTESAVVVLYFRDVDMLEIARFHAGQKLPLAKRVRDAEDLASIVGEFLQVPVRQPTPPGRGFEVVVPVRS